MGRLRTNPLPQFASPNTPLYRVQLGEVFHPGAGLESFISPWESPVVLVRGRGRYAGTLRVTQPKPSYYTHQNAVAGLGGLQAGQIILQPLLDPSQFEGD